MSEPLTILVTDDEPNIRLMIRTVLAGDGYHVIEAADGEAAVVAMHRTAFDVLLLDLNMPRLDGLGVLKELRRNPPLQFPRPVVLTAYGSIDKAVKATRLGAMDFLEKPITPDQLRQSLTAILQEPLPSMGGVDIKGEVDGYQAVLTRVRKALRLDDLATAEALLMRAADLAHDDAAYLNLLGIIYESRNQHRLAEKFYLRAVKTNKGFQPAKDNIRRLHHLNTHGRTTMPPAMGDEPDIWFARLP